MAKQYVCCKIIFLSFEIFLVEGERAMAFLATVLLDLSFDLLDCILKNIVCDATLKLAVCLRWLKPDII
jgi:hypothetical protein